MILDKERRFAFIHIPRTGGTSIRSVLGGDPNDASSSMLNNDGIETSIIEQKFMSMSVNSYKWSHWSHMSVDIMEKQYWEQYNYIFTCVRNPWARLFSLYKKAFVGAPSCSFESFVGTIYINLHNNHTADFLHTTQDFWFSSPQGIQIDTVRFEDLSDENQWNHLMDKCGVKNKCRPHDNKSESRQDYKAAYSRPSRYMVAVMESKTIDRFGYEF
tara:strand:- start:10259 stop:10903 length:645 start_codon:yes stop_codon:yes gene_type:complete